tara:strand:- start:188 stop:325 length:138 start_codon:yes stop_codon:yes gene_type:complete
MKYNSKLIHAGWDSDADPEGAITVPIYRTTAFNLTILNMLLVCLL